jgi:hypothetical protein
MGQKGWQPIRNFDQARLRAARLQAHFALQWLARAAFAYVPAQAGDVHSTLGWDDSLGGLVTFALPDGTELGLRFADLTLVLLSGGAVRESFPLHGRRDADARAWLGPLMTARGLDAGALDKPLPYKLPESKVGSVEPYVAAENAVGLKEHVVWFANCNGAIVTALEKYVPRNLDAPPVRCWPHHFDLDSLVTIRPDHSTGVGYEPGDHFYDEPYFYVSFNPKPDLATLPPPPAASHWHGNKFTAAVATATNIVQAPDQGAAVDAYLRFAIETALRVLG